MEPHAFRRAAETKDFDLMRETLAEDVVLHSPILFKGFEGRDMSMIVLSNVSEVFEDFRYLDEVHGDGSVVLRFAAKVDDKFEIEGIDYLTLDEDGRRRPCRLSTSGWSPVSAPRRPPDGRPSRIRDPVLGECPSG
jgi:hypothetical protein